MPIADPQPPTEKKGPARWKAWAVIWGKKYTSWRLEREWRREVSEALAKQEKG